MPWIRRRIDTEKRDLYRFNCVSVLNQIRSPEAIEALRALSRDRHPWCRTEAVWSLGQARDVESLPIIAERLKQDAEPSVRKEALIALGAIAGVSLHGVSPQGQVQFASDIHLTDDARKELDRVVKHYMEEKSCRRPIPSRGGSWVSLSKGTSGCRSST